MPKFYEELNLVLDELKDINANEEQNSELLTLSDDKRVELFLKLKEGLISKRVKKYKPAIQEIEKYKLEADDKKIFSKVKSLVKEYNLDDAIDLLYWQQL